jgi:hypothetical protein
MDFKDIGRESEDWIHLAEDRALWRILLISVINLPVPGKAKMLYES